MPYVKIKKITQSHNEDVYNLEADKYHNFAVNGGLIVHNCADALRYAFSDMKPSAIASIPASNRAALLQPRHRR